MEERIVLERADVSKREDIRGRDPIEVLEKVQEFLLPYQEAIRGRKFICAMVLGFAPSNGVYTATLTYSRLP